MQKIKKYGLRALGILGIIYLLLLIPDFDKPSVVKPADKPFAWNQDSLWSALENNFAKTKTQSPMVIDSTIASLFYRQDELFKTIKGCKLDLADSLLSQPKTNAGSEFEATDSSLSEILSNYFSLASLVAASPVYREKFISDYNKIRSLVKSRSQHWDLGRKDSRTAMYKLLYGMRAATEEVLLQTGNVSFNPALTVTHVVSATPAATILGMEVHSGDLLLSRGGAEVSALISRGNNYPGNFSHVALLYVDEKTNLPYLIEAHIEKGVAIAAAEQYINDKKLRCMVLRPRADLPQLMADPLLPHKAALMAYQKALGKHIPYDFKMNFNDSSAMFCSEVGSFAYKKMGIQLWQAPSAISSPGVINWLSAFGVENFVTQMPSDLEYDPQLNVVAEWRDPETLAKDHLDNAVMDALLEQADQGKLISYNHWQLPLVRLVKGWCMIKNMFGGIGIIPEGMSAIQALKNQSFVAMYAAVKKETEILVNQFVKENHYQPPYWKLVAMAKKATLKQR